MNDTNLRQREDGPVQEKKTWLRTLLSVIFLWIPLTLAGGNVVLGLAGVCMSPLSYLTKDEIIEVAVRSLPKEKLQSNSQAWNAMNTNDSEESLQKFLRDNPRCCDAMRTGGLLELLAGWSMYEVEVNYERSPDRPSSHTEPFYQQYILVNSCGKVIKSAHGMSYKTPEATQYIRK